MSMDHARLTERSSELPRDRPSARPSERPSERLSGSRRSTSAALRLAGFKILWLDFLIGLGRKVGGFCGLLALGWLYFRLLVLGHSLHDIYPDATDPDLRQTLWVALFLIMAQGWDIPTDQIVAHWHRVRARRASAPASDRARTTGTDLRPSVSRFGPARRIWRALEPTVVRLERFMDLCVAVANKVGALAVLGYLLYLGEQFALRGVGPRALYPMAADPTVSLLADLCVYVVVLGWWAMPLEQIAIFWRRLRERP